MGLPIIPSPMKPIRSISRLLSSPLVKRYIKPNQQQGGIVEKEAPLHISNVMPLDPEDGRPTRVGFRIIGG